MEARLAALNQPPQDELFLGDTEVIVEGQGPTLTPIEGGLKARIPCSATCRGFDDDDDSDDDTLNLGGTTLEAAAGTASLRAREADTDEDAPTSVG